jgi:hypothetical protein
MEVSGFKQGKSETLYSSALRWYLVVQCLLARQRCQLFSSDSQAVDADDDSWIRVDEMGAWKHCGHQANWIYLVSKLEFFEDLRLPSGMMRFA